MLPFASLAPILGSKRSVSTPMLPDAIHRWSADDWATSGSDVLSIADSVGSDAIVAGATKPTTTLLNGRNAVAFNGNSWLEALLGASDTFTSISWLTVWNPVDLSTAQNHWASKRAAAAAASVLAFTFPAFAEFCPQLNATNIVQINGVIGTGPQVSLFTYDGAPASGSRRVRMWMSSGGIAVYGSSDTQSLTPDDVDAWIVGARQDHSSPTLSSIAEFTVGTSFIEDADAPGLISAFMNAYGIT
jgi:hypothetical protein